MMTDATVETELESLQTKCKIMGIKHHPKAGVDTLKAKIAELDAPVKEVIVPAEPVPETKAQISARMRKEALKQVRVQITCLNPSKKDWQGDFFSVGNKFTGQIKKFIVFNGEGDDGYHVPSIILEYMKDKQFRVSKTKKIGGKKVKVNKLVKEFLIVELPPLSLEELKVLAAKQAKEQLED